MAQTTIKHEVIMEEDILQQEKNVSEAFSRQSFLFDEIYEHNPITLLMREKVRNEVLTYISKGDKILELICGTGIDTVFFCEKRLPCISYR